MRRWTPCESDGCRSAASRSEPHGACRFQAEARTGHLCPPRNRSWCAGGVAPAAIARSSSLEKLCFLQSGPPWQKRSSHFAEPQHLRHRRPWNPPPARLPFAPVRQAGIAVSFQPLPPAAHRPVRHPQDLRRRPPRDPLGHRLQQHVLHSHHPLHLGGRVLPGLGHPNSVSDHQPQSGQIVCELDRTNHMLTTTGRTGRFCLDRGADENYNAAHRRRRGSCIWAIRVCAA